MTKIDDETFKILANLTHMAAEASLREDWEKCAQYLNEATIEIVKASSKHIGEELVKTALPIQEISPFDLPDVIATIEKKNP